MASSEALSQEMTESSDTNVELELALDTAYDAFCSALQALGWSMTGDEDSIVEMLASLIGDHFENDNADYEPEDDETSEEIVNESESD